MLKNTLHKVLTPYACLLAVIFLLPACKMDPVVCADKFEMVGIRVSGGILTDYFTVNTSNSDTIRYTASRIYPKNNIYPVLDDSYQVEIMDTKESFHFVGLIGEEVVVEETYVIRADRCHVYKVRGKETVRVRKPNA